MGVCICESFLAKENSVLKIHVCELQNSSDLQVFKVKVLKIELYFVPLRWFRNTNSQVKRHIYIL